MHNFFKVTEEHIKLLQSMYVSWFDCEYGAPCINPKRPYGNSFVEGDIAKILGWLDNNDDEDDFPEELYEKCATIHSEMETVLQILVSNLSIQPGTYTKTRLYTATSWRFFSDRVGEKIAD